MTPAVTVVETPNCAYLQTLPVIPKGLVKNGKSEREGGGGGLTIMEFRGHGGVIHFGISEGKGGGGGVKIWKPSVGRYGYFLESPIKL